MPPGEQALWQCPQCRRRFANRNQSHSCARLHDLAHHFEGKPPEIRALFDHFVRAVTRLGPVTVLPEKTRIAFQVRMSFAQLTPRQRWLDGHLVLARRVEAPVFRKVESFSPRNHLHTFRLTSTEDLTPELKGYLKEAYAVGAQRHLGGKRQANSSGLAKETATRGSTEILRKKAK